MAEVTDLAQVYIVNYFSARFIISYNVYVSPNV